MTPFLGIANAVNPVLDEIDRAHASLSPPAQEAIRRARTLNPAGVSPEGMNPSGGAPALPAGNPAPVKPIAPPPAPVAPLQPSANQQELSRITAPTPQGMEHTKAATGESGIAQIHNPWARIPLQIADAIGSGVAPGIAMGIPGTQAHHNILVRERTRDVNQEQAATKNRASVQQTEAETKELGTRAEHETAESEALRHPPEKEKPEDEQKTIETDKGIMQWNPSTHRYDIPAGSAPGKTTGNVHVLPDGSVISVNHDAKTGKSSAEVLYKGDPKVETEVKQIQVGGKPHQVLFEKGTGRQIKDLGESGEKPPVTTINQQEAALDRETQHYGKAHQSAVTAASAQLEKITEAQEMVRGNAEAQALAIPKVLTALVSGQGTGVRITQPELNSIAKARGLAGDVEGTLRSWAGKGKLTPEQQKQLDGILEDAKSRIMQKRDIANDALDRINGAKSRDEIISVDKEARQKMQDFESGKSHGAGGSGMINVQIPGHPPGQIHPSQKDNFLRDNPGAKVLP